MHWDEYTTTKDSQQNEHVPQHPYEAKEYGGIHANLVDDIQLFRPNDGRYPGEEPIADGWRCMFCVGMFGFWRI